MNINTKNLLNLRLTYKKKVDNTIIFLVDKGTNKLILKRYIQLMYKIKIKKINSSIIKNKKKIYIIYENL